MADARSAAARIHELGKRMVKYFPESARAHLLLTAAYDQMAKNAFRADDKITIEKCHRLALESSIRAVETDPNSRDGLHEFEVQRKKLARFLTENK